MLDCQCRLATWPPGSQRGSPRHQVTREIWHLPRVHLHRAVSVPYLRLGTADAPCAGQPRLPRRSRTTPMDANHQHSENAGTACSCVQSTHSHTAYHSPPAQHHLRIFILWPTGLPHHTQPQPSLANAGILPTREPLGTKIHDGLCFFSPRGAVSMKHETN